MKIQQYHARGEWKCINCRCGGFITGPKKMSKMLLQQRGNQEHKECVPECKNENVSVKFRKGKPIP